jgi:DNA-binding CsgD family transcriptional regulator/thiol-disulfide isomerase/thioredoxin
VDARQQLRTVTSCSATWASGRFAEHARRELRATGETARKRVMETRDDLTSEEDTIARLASDGFSNPEIGARLFIRPRTVEWHLRKISASRRELSCAMRCPSGPACRRRVASVAGDHTSRGFAHLLQRLSAVARPVRLPARSTHENRMSASIDSALSPLDRAPVWLNSEPLTAKALRGRVVLVDFWTYSCVNWLRTLPYVRAWDATYRDRGLVVVGVHAPEFRFEHELDNVRRAVSDLGVGYPVVTDNDFSIWRSFENRYWPALYLVDRDGRIRFHHFGEEAYEETERAIQRLLEVDEELVSVDAGGLAAAADWDTLRSAETYVGYARSEGRSDRRADGLALNQWAVAGQWTVEEEAAVLEAAAGSIAYRFEARDLNLVLAPSATGARVRFAVHLDGRPPGDAHGLDVDESGGGSVSEPRMYQLVRQSGVVAQRDFEITFLDAGVRAYVFTFG